MIAAASCPASLEPFDPSALLLLADMTKGFKEAERGISCQAEEKQIP